MTLSFDVTRRKLQLGSRDSTTGLYDKSYVETSIDMPIVSAEAAKKLLPVGSQVVFDRVGFTQDVVVEGDEIVTAADVYYLVQTVKLHWIGDSFVYRECQLSVLPYGYA